MSTNRRQRLTGACLVTDRGSMTVGHSDVLRAGVAAIADLVLPRPCPGCGGPGPWCGGCAATLQGRPRRVAMPQEVGAAALPGYAPVWALARYAGPVRAAIVTGKERGRRDLPGSLGLALGHGLLRLRTAAPLPAALWLVPAPSRRAAARARGGDPVAVMARAAARYRAAHGEPTGVAPCLVTVGAARDSVGLDADARAENLRNRVRWRSAAAPPAGAPVLLIDDVFTTGATSRVAVQVLRAAELEVLGVLVLSAVPGWVGVR